MDKGEFAKYAVIYGTNLLVHRDTHTSGKRRYTRKYLCETVEISSISIRRVKNKQKQNRGMEQIWLDLAEIKLQQSHQTRYCEQGRIQDVTQEEAI